MTANDVIYRVAGHLRTPWSVSQSGFSRSGISHSGISQSGILWNLSIWSLSIWDLSIWNLPISQFGIWNLESSDVCTMGATTRVADTTHASQRTANIAHPSQQRRKNPGARCPRLAKSKLGELPLRILPSLEENAYIAMYHTPPKPGCGQFLVTKFQAAFSKHKP